MITSRRSAGRDLGRHSAVSLAVAELFLRRFCPITNVHNFVRTLARDSILSTHYVANDVARRLGPFAGCEYKNKYLLVHFFKATVGLLDARFSVF